MPATGADNPVLHNSIHIASHYMVANIAGADLQ